MTARLGQVLYWAGCGAAVICAVPALMGLLVILGGGSINPVVTGLFGLKWAAGSVGVFLIGRACRYVLAAR